MERNPMTLEQGLSQMTAFAQIHYIQQHQRTLRVMHGFTTDIGVKDFINKELAKTNKILQGYGVSNGLDKKIISPNESSNNAESSTSIVH